VLADLQTVHIDDLSRNFAMNPGEGLKVSLTGAQSPQIRPDSQIRAYKGAGTQAGVDDSELAKLRPYVSLCPFRGAIAKTSSWSGWPKRN
jgi:hypothetical protein